MSQANLLLWAYAREHKLGSHLLFSNKSQKGEKNEVSFKKLKLKIEASYHGKVNKNKQIVGK